MGSAQKEFTQIFPVPGWVEHNPEEIWATQLETANQVLSDTGISANGIAAIGITNQRETTLVWDRETGKPVCNAIVWQDRRTAKFCDDLKKEGLEEVIRGKTGLVIDAYFSATKLNWILNNIEGTKQKAVSGKLAFGTVDTWLIWKLTGGKVHVTDVSNASRTMLFNIHTLEWDNELLELFQIPALILPEVYGSSQYFAEITGDLPGSGVPLTGMAGDQQAALFGQLCTEEGMAKNTYGTGCFLVMNTGIHPVVSKKNMLATVAWQMNGNTTYALEGSIFITGAAVQWLRDGLGIIESAEESEYLASGIPDNGGIYFVPALTGLGAPHWDPYARGSVFGITRGTTRAHLCRATLESISYQVYDVVSAMHEDTGQEVRELRVDGGAVKNNFLMQFQSDILGMDVIRPLVLETTALGAAYLAGLASGYWKDISDIQSQWKAEKVFSPRITRKEAEKLIKGWRLAIARAKNWVQ